MNPSEMRERLRNLARVQPGRQWFRIVNAAVPGGPSQVMLYDEIGFYGVSAAAFNEQLSALDGPVELYINSPGGEIFDGISIYNQLLRLPEVSVFIDGIAASAASFIAQAASPGKLGMAKNAKMMIHNGQAFAAGDASDLRKMADLLDAETLNIASIYADRSGQPADYFLAMMAAETWLSGTQACDKGLADFVFDPRKGPQNVIRVRQRNAATSPGDNNGWLMREGKWVFDPKDDGDDDYQASTDTDRDYWDAQGHQLHPIPASPDGKHPAKPMPEPAAAAAASSNHWTDIMTTAMAAWPDATPVLPGSTAVPVPAAVSKPHGDVEYADPGYLDADGEQASKSGKEGVARYPIDAEHVEAAWSYINQEKNAGQYTAEQLALIKGKIKAAMKQHGHEVSEDAVDLHHLLALGRG